MEDNLHLGQRVAFFRKLKGINQKDLGTKINKTRALISFIERTGKINHRTLKLIAGALEITMEDLHMTDEELNMFKNSGINSLKSQLDDKVVLELEFYKRENELLHKMLKQQEKLVEQHQKNSKQQDKIIQYLEEKKSDKPGDKVSKSKS